MYPRPLEPPKTPTNATQPRTQTELLASPSLSPISTISYFPAPSLPLPLPLPTAKPVSSSPPSLTDWPRAAVPAALPPNEIGRNSRYRQAQTPRTVMSAVLATCSTHHDSDEGTERVYRDVTRRCRMWIVQAKSGTSLERAMRRRR